MAPSPYRRMVGPGPQGGREANVRTRKIGAFMMLATLLVACPSPAGTPPPTLPPTAAPSTSGPVPPGGSEDEIFGEVWAEGRVPPPHHHFPGSPNVALVSTDDLWGYITRADPENPRW